jgi:hypothetical protein
MNTRGPRHVGGYVEQDEADDCTASVAAMATVATSPDDDLGVDLSPTELELGVIKEARRRQRRRRLAVAFTLLAASGLTITIAFGARGGATPRHPQLRSRPGRTSGAITPPAAVFVQDPYMGVACHIPNSITCDRVGLAVWLRRPAITITATIAGAPLKLNDPGWSYVAHYGRKTVYVYAGFLQPAGLVTRLHITPEANTSTWLGSNAPSPIVRFRIDYGHGNIAVTQEHVWLSAGWG